MSNIEEILSHEYSEEFDERRKEKVTISYYKYGPIKENFGKGYVQAIPTCQKCIKKYEETGNTEYLADAANYLMFEFMYPQKEGAYYKNTDSDGSAGLVGMSINEIKEFDAENKE